MSEDLVSVVKFTVGFICSMMVIAVAMHIPVAVYNTHIRSTWNEADTVVVDHNLIDVESLGVSMAGRVPIVTKRTTTNKMVYYVYNVDGKDYTGVCKVDNSLSIGSRIIILYNPDNIGESVRK